MSLSVKIMINHNENSDKIFMASASLRTDFSNKTIYSNINIFLANITAILFNNSNNKIS